MASHAFPQGPPPLGPPHHSAAPSPRADLAPSPSLAASPFPLSSQHGGYPPSTSAAHLPAPPHQTAPAIGVATNVYTAVYSGVPVYEMMVRGIAVMRRRQDSYMNATQILKLAGIDKGKRTKILEREILTGEHEKVQGGYGKYQGTWVPFERGEDLVARYNVGHLLRPLLDFAPSAAPPGAGSSAFEPLSSQPSLGPPPPSNTRPGRAPSAQPRFMPTPARNPYDPGQSGQQPPHRAGMGMNVPQPVSGRFIADGYPGGSSQAGYSSYDRGPVGGPGPSTSSANADHLNGEFNAGVKRPREVDAGISPRVTDGFGLAPGAPIDMDGRSPASKRLRPSKPHELVVNHEGDALNALNRAIRAGPPPSGAPGVAAGKRPAAVPLEGINGRMSNSQRQRALLMSIFQDEGTAKLEELLRTHRTVATANPAAAEKESEGANGTALSLSGKKTPLIVPEDPNAPLLDVNLIIDEHGHTALHWACALARTPLVALLIAHGANPNLGNYAGETPLQRSVLVTNAYDAGCFPDLLRILAPSLRTLDASNRSVLHHICLIASLKGRSASARYYMETIFGYIAKEEKGRFRALVDAADENGDTALNVAARVGNRSLVRMLVEVGADKSKPNNLGLRPGDFYVEGEDLNVATPGDIVASLRKDSSVPVQKSQGVIEQMTSVLRSLSTDFTAELKGKQDTLETTQVSLRAATRELAEQRRQVQYWQSRVAELDEARQRVKNLEVAIAEEPSAPTEGTLSGETDAEVCDPKESGEDADALVALRRRKAWYEKAIEAMVERIGRLEGASAEKEVKCKKVVAMCCGVPVEKVEKMLDQLVVAIESDGANVDLGRVAGFMSKVRDRSGT